MIITLKRVLHKIAHWTGWYYGEVETWWEVSVYDEQLMVGFRCSTCGTLEGVHESQNG